MITLLMIVFGIFMGGVIIELIIAVLYGTVEGLGTAIEVLDDIGGAICGFFGRLSPDAKTTLSGIALIILIMSTITSGEWGSFFIVLLIYFGLKFLFKKR